MAQSHCQVADPPRESHLSLECVGTGLRSRQSSAGRKQMVELGNKYKLFDPETGNLDRRVFTDQAIYDEEMDKIFGRSWLMVAHESLVPKKNDFFLSYMGQDPVIVTRDSDNKI